MQILPTTSGTRPGLACELRPGSVVAARRTEGGGSMAAVAKCDLPEGTFRPGLRGESIVDRGAVISAIRQTLEKVVGRTRQTTLIVPDASVRVLLLEFDSLPGKLAEALPIVRFRLKKLLPFDADGAALSYQVMSSSRGMVRVVAVAMPRETLVEYESAVREAGFEPGAVLPSTLAVLAGMEESEDAALLVNAGPEAVTAAIVRNGILLLHRSVDMRADVPEQPAEPQTTPPIPSELFANPDLALPLVDRESSVEEWARQEGAEEYAARGGGSSSTQTALLEPPAAVILAPPAELPSAEIVQAVSVAAAYFEDTLGIVPSSLLSAGATSATHLSAMLQGTPLEGWTIQEALPPGTLPSGQGPAGMSGSIPRGLLAGVQGALRG